MHCVNYMGEEEGQPLLQGECPIFEWVPGVPIVDDGTEVEYLEDHSNNSNNEEEMPDVIDNYKDSDSDEDSDDEESEDDGNNDNDDDNDVINDNRSNDDDGSDNFDQNHNPDKVLNGGTTNDDHLNNSNNTPAPGQPTVHEAPRSNTADQRSENTAEDAPTIDKVDKAIATDNNSSTEGADQVPTHRYNLRNNRQRKYDNFNGNYTNPHQFIHFMNKNEKCVDTYQFIVAMCFTQMSAAKGIKMYGQAAVDALLKEFSQLNDLKCFKSICASTLSSAEKKAALRAINLIKEKRCGKIKGRSVADGRGQRHLYSREDTSSPY